MPVEFKRRAVVSEFESPFENFRTVRASGEIRYCPLSGHPARVLPMRLKNFAREDWTAAIKGTREAGCPFCPGAVELKTPRFPRSYGLDEGRIRAGEAVVFPNAFPYDDHCAVVVFTREHYLPPGGFSPEMLRDGFAASLRYFAAAARVAPAARQALLNWNYMPLAGAGIVHPHLQAALLPEMTAYYRSVCARQADFAASEGGSIFAELTRREMQAGERYVAATGKWQWFSAFAPRGIYEFFAILNPGEETAEPTEGDLADLARGICRVLGFFESKGVQAFNLSWYFLFNPPAAGMRHWAALVPRVNFPGIGTSDVNYFDRLHGESITFASPEEAAREVRDFFP